MEREEYGSGEEETFDVAEANRMITAIQNYMAENKPDFDDSFVCSLQEQLEAKDHLSLKQISALERIIDGFEIDVDQWAD